MLQFNFAEDSKLPRVQKLHKKLKEIYPNITLYKSTYIYKLAKNMGIKTIEGMCTLATTLDPKCPRRISHELY